MEPYNVFSENQMKATDTGEAIKESGLDVITCGSGEPQKKRKAAENEYENWHPLRTLPYVVNRCVTLADKNGVTLPTIAKACGIPKSMRTRHSRIDQFLRHEDLFRSYQTIEGKNISTKFIRTNVEDVYSEYCQKFEQLAKRKVPGTSTHFSSGFAKTDRALKALVGLLEYFDAKNFTGNVGMNCVELRSFLVDRYKDPGMSLSGGDLLRKALNLLLAEGFIRTYEETVKFCAKERKILIYIRRSVEKDDPELVKAIDDAREQAMLAMQKDHGNKIKSEALADNAAPAGESTAGSSRVDFVAGETERSAKLGRPKSKGRPVADEHRALMTYHSHAVSDNGYQRRMLRLHLLHQFLYYVVYAYEGDTLAELEAADQPPSSSSADDSGGAASGAPQTVYLNEISWKRFIPPVSVEAISKLGLSHGWFHLDDLLDIMPLSIYTQVVAMEFKIEGLAEYLNDPIRRHTLIKDMPFLLRCCLLHGRRFPTKVGRELDLLCGMGLLSPGAAAVPPGSEEKELSAQKLYFVHRHASVLDTTTSDLSYHSVSLPLSRYKQYDYVFETSDDVQLFWHHVNAVSFNTALGYSSVSEKEPETTLQAKIRNYSTLKTFGISVLPCAEVEALEANRGKFFSADQQMFCGDAPVMPGACGFHTCLYTYRRQHWQPNRSACVQWFLHDFQAWRAKLYEHVTKRCARLIGSWHSEVYHRGVVGTKPAGMHVKAARSTLSAGKAAAIKRSADVSSLDAAKDGQSMLPKRKRIRPSRAKPKAQRGATAQLDATDTNVVMHRYRERLAPTKDEIATFFRLKAVNCLLSPKSKLCINVTRLRDIMHQYCPETLSKTANQLNMMANRETQKNPEQLRAMVSLLKDHSELMGFIHTLPRVNFSMTEAERGEIFTKVFQKLMEVLSRPATIELPDSIDEFRQRYRLDEGVSSASVRPAVVDASTVGSVRFFILQSLVSAHHALNDADKGACMAQTQRVHNQFSDRELAVAVESLIARGVFATGKYGDDSARLKRSQLDGEEVGSWPGSSRTDLASVRRGDITFCFNYRQFFLSKQCVQVMDFGFRALQSICSGDNASGISAALVPIGGKASSSFLSLMGAALLDSNMSIDADLPQTLVPEFVIDKILKKEGPSSPLVADLEPSDSSSFPTGSGYGPDPIAQDPQEEAPLRLDLSTSSNESMVMHPSSGYANLKPVSFLHVSSSEQPGSSTRAAGESETPNDPHNLPTGKNEIKCKQKRSANYSTIQPTAKMRMTRAMALLRTERLESFPEDEPILAPGSVPGGTTDLLKKASRRKALNINCLLLNACKVFARYDSAFGILSADSIRALRERFEACLARLGEMNFAPSVRRWLENLFDSGTLDYPKDWAKAAVCLTPEQNAAAELIWSDYLKKFSSLNGTGVNDNTLVLTRVFVELEKAGCIGVTEQDLLKLRDVCLYSEELLHTCLRLLKEGGLIISVGTTATRYVSFKWSPPWLVRSFHAAAISGPNVPSSSSKPQHGCVSVPFFMVPKPWLRPDGTANQPMLKWYLQALLVQLLANPGVRESEICRKMEPVLEFGLTVELLQLMCELGLMKRSHLLVRKPSPFGQEIKAAEKVAYYDPERHCQTLFHVLFADTPLPDFATGGSHSTPKAELPETDS